MSRSRWVRATAMATDYAGARVPPSTRSGFSHRLAPGETTQTDAPTLALFPGGSAAATRATGTLRRGRHLWDLRRSCLLVVVLERGAMSPPARLFGSDRVEIVDLDSWFRHAPPEKGAAQWRDWYSVKEQAKAWLRSHAPAVPEELWSAIADLAASEVDEVYGRPKHRT